MFKLEAFPTSLLSSLLTLRGQPSLDIRLKILTVNYLLILFNKGNILLLNNADSYSSLFSQIFGNFGHTDLNIDILFIGPSTRSKKIFYNHFISPQKTSWQEYASTEIQQIKCHVYSWITNNQPNSFEKGLADPRQGHTTLTHSYLLLQEETFTCEICIVKITVYQILIECPKYSSQ